MFKQVIIKTTEVLSKLFFTFSKVSYQLIKIDGTTIDFTTPKIGAVLTGFDSTPSFAWLKEHAYEYGFILSYPKGNGHFVFEPWHWRYIGITLAKRLHDEGKNFYDLDQRSIDNYLVNIFD